MENNTYDILQLIIIAVSLSIPDLCTFVVMRIARSPNQTNININEGIQAKVEWNLGTHIIRTFVCLCDWTIQREGPVRTRIVLTPSLTIFAFTIRDLAHVLI
jgi:hypothetical protein